MKLLFAIRKMHGWLGFIILPWIVAYGQTGFYLNHSRLVNGWFPTVSEEQRFTEFPEREWLSIPEARAIAGKS